MYQETVQSERLYAKVAERYESVFERAILSEARLTELARASMNGKRVLDLACGNGRWLDRFAPGEYVGIDLNERMLKQARWRYPDHMFIRGDMTCLPFADNSFDGIMSMFGAMGHIPLEGQHRMISEIYRVMTPGATAILTNGNMWSPFNLPTTIKGNRVRLEGVRFKVHSTHPRAFAKMLAGFEILHLESYDYSYLPVLPFKVFSSLMNHDYRADYHRTMAIFDHCRYIPTLRWFGKQLLAVCRK